MKNFIALPIIFLLSAVAAGADKTPTGPANRLGKENSPYLRQHAHNPVDWFPWGPEAFEKAKKEGKLVFLSIGYSSCHWCHVMERESFANADVAKIMNENFVCIKVDREERPDVDDVYMNALQVLGQGGGWPLSMFLLPDGKPIVGGTYWPPDDRVIEGETVKGFKTILKLVKQIHKDHTKEITEQANKIAEVTRERLAQRVRGVALVDLNDALVTAAVTELGEEFDATHGGFGRKARAFRGTKFPMPSYLELLHVSSGNAESKKQLRTTLDKMAEGGIYDQVGGGFHRYSTERTWTVPHFEKMLYDNAQLVEVYAKAHAVEPKPLYDRTVRETLDFVLREMTSPEGGFYSALDADSEGEEGRFYVWTPKDLEAALTDKDELALARAVYGVERGINFENKYSIPTRNEAVAEIAAKRKITVEQLETKMKVIRLKLFDVRAKRERPFLDTKVLAAWNGQMIAAFAVAGKVLKEPKYIDAAKKAADFVLKSMRNKDGRLYRSYLAETGKPGTAKLNGYLDDYAFFIHGLLALHDTTGEARWLTDAKALADLMVTWHWDKEGGGFFYTSHDHEKLFARSKDQFDGAQPSGNSVAARDLVRLYARTKDTKYKDLAQKQFTTFAAVLKASPTTLTTMVAALKEFLPFQTATPADTPKLPGGGDKAIKSDSVIKVTAVADKPATDGTQVVTITMMIEKPWHAYANPIENEMLDGAKTVVTVSGKGSPKVEKIDYPKGAKVADKIVGDYMVYDGKVTIKATVKRAAGDKEPLDVSVKFMACEAGKNGKAGRCLLPATVTIKVP